MAVARIMHDCLYAASHGSYLSGNAAQKTHAVLRHRKFMRLCCACRWSRVCVVLGQRMNMLRHGLSSTQKMK